MAWPTTTDPRTEFVTLRLTVSEAADLDLYAGTRGMNRSKAVRDAVNRVIAAEKKRAKRAKRVTVPGGAMLDPESRHRDGPDQAGPDQAGPDQDGPG